MLTSTMMNLPGTKIYIFVGIFKNLPKCENVPVIEHFQKVLNEKEREALIVKFHMTANGIHNRILKIGFYIMKQKSDGENGRDKTTDHKIIEMQKVINMKKRA